MIISVFFKKQGWANRLISLVGRIKEDKGRSRNQMILRSLWLLLSTRSLGPYRPLLLAPAEGIGGPFGPSLGGPFRPPSPYQILSQKHQKTKKNLLKINFLPNVHN